MSKKPWTYPDCPLVSRTVRIGGTGKPEFFVLLQRRGIKLNEAGLALFADDRFIVSEAALIVETVEITVANLGFAEGATIAEIYGKAVQVGLAVCPLELGPHLRLQYLDQPEGHIGHAPTQHRAPPGSLTIASDELTEDDEIPKGFYLRRIDGGLWLRGYHSGAEHVWSPEDHFVFTISPSSA